MNMKWQTIMLAGMALWLGLAGLAHAGTVTYVYTDPQGTPLAEADAQGNIIARYDYAPYGTSVASLGAPPNGPGYTGHVNDPDTGFVYMQARYYDPAVGRFLSVDPVTAAAGNTFNFNRYSYANNNPIDNIDPDGREAACVSMGRHCLSPTSDPVGNAKKLAPLIPIVGDLQNLNDAIRNPTIGTITIAAIGALPEIGPALAKSIKTADHLIEAAGKLTRLKGGVRQGEVVGDAKTLMANITHGGEKISGGRVKMSDGTIIGSHTSTKTGVSTIDINNGERIYKIRVHSETNK